MRQLYLHGMVKGDQATFIHQIQNNELHNHCHEAVFKSELWGHDMLVAPWNYGQGDLQIK